MVVRLGLGTEVSTVRHWLELGQQASQSWELQLLLWNRRDSV